MWRKKLISTLLALSLVATALAGCGGTEEATEDISSTSSESSSEVASTESSSDEKITLRLMTISTDGNQTTILNDYILKNIEEAFPNVELEYEPGGGGDDNANKLKTYNASGDLPDVWYSTADSAGAILSAGNMQDLTQYITDDGFIDKYAVPEALQYNDGSIYTITSGADTYFTPRIFYNKEMFEEYGLEEPTTYDELLEICVTLKENGEVPMSIAGQGGWAPQLFLMQTMIQMEDPQVAIDILSNTGDFDNQVVVNAANRISEMAQIGAFPDGVTNLSYTNSREMFTTGRAAMFGGFSWEVSGFAELEDFTVDMCMWPSASEGVVVEDTTQYWGSPLNGYAVNPNSENLEMAVKLAEFCVEQEAEFYATQGNVLNIETEGASDSSEMSSLMEKNIELYNGAEQKIASIMLNCMDTKVATEFATYGSNLLTGEYSGEDFAKEFNAVWEENTYFD
ncbi:MAG: extracellular solute-binding protein [Eubacteriales bacterium]